MTVFGLWCSKPSFADVQLAADLGFTRLDCMVNDLSKQRSPTPFKLDWSPDAYRNVVAHALHVCGIEEVHFTAWAMPHAVYMSYAGDALQQLCIDAGAHGIVLDAEEPWTLASKPDYGGAAAAFYQEAKGCRVGITGIGYCNTDKLGPLMASADYGIPQAYVVRKRKVDVLTHAGIPKVIAHWRKFGKPLHIGLAAYAQSGIPGHTTKSAMRATFAAVQDECEGVSYWSLRQLKGNTLVRETLRRLMEESKSKQAKEGAA